MDPQHKQKLVHCTAFRAAGLIHGETYAMLEDGIAVDLFVLTSHDGHRQLNRYQHFKEIFQIFVNHKRVEIQRQLI